MEKNGIQEWLKNNSWNLLVTGIAIIAGITLVQQQVRALQDEQAEIKRDVAKYPSKEWFDLRFSGIDEKFGIMGRDIQEIQNDLKTHVGN